MALALRAACGVRVCNPANAVGFCPPEAAGSPGMTIGLILSRASEPGYLISKSFSFLPDFSAATNQRGRLPRPDHVSLPFGLRYFGATLPLPPRFLPYTCAKVTPSDLSTALIFALTLVIFSLSMFFMRPFALRMRSLSCFSLSELTSMAMLTPTVGDNENLIGGLFSGIYRADGLAFSPKYTAVAKSCNYGSIGGG